VKVLVDVNIFIDVMTKRANWQTSLRVLSLVRRAPEVEGWTAALTVPLLYFFRLRVTDEKRARADAQASVTGFSLVPLTQNVIDKALASELPDFEDNIQLISAENISAAHLITWNTKHFQSALLSIRAPEEWLALETVLAIEASLQD
jgi:hypothetical protein